MSKNGHRTEKASREMIALMANAMTGGDKSQVFPRSDAEDILAGCRRIPDEVTDARRDGEVVTFYRQCANPCCWYWVLPDGKKIFNWEKQSYLAIARANGLAVRGGGYPSEAGACPNCGNVYTNGETVEP